MEDFKAVISLWPSVSAFAEDIGVPYSHASQMKWRNSVPAQYWAPMVAAAERREIAGVSLSLLAELAGKKRSESSIRKADGCAEPNAAA